MLESELSTNQKEAIAIERIKNFDPLKNGFSDSPYYVAYSGGKDSDVLRILFELSGVKFDLVHNYTTVDAPETVKYIRTIPNLQISYPEKTMFQLIEEKKFPPTRLIRYCCAELKERGGKGRVVATGVRWEESLNRRNSAGVAQINKRKRQESLILLNDNDDSRKMFENCQLKGKRLVNPIVDWTVTDIWNFLNYYFCPSNPLYQEGFERIGCVGCPNMRKREKLNFPTRFPLHYKAYLNTFEKIVPFCKDGKNNWETGQDIMDWWLS